MKLRIKLIFEIKITTAEVLLKKFRRAILVLK
jgi:hypothetical protein